MTPRVDLKLALRDYEMTEDELWAFLNGVPRFAAIASLRRDGGPIVDGIGYEWDGTSMYFSIRQTRALMKRLSRDRRICMHVMNTEYPVQWVRMEGMAEPIEDPDYRRTFRIMHKYMAVTSQAQQLENFDMSSYERSYVEFGRTLHRLTPERVHSHDARKQAKRFDLSTGRLLEADGA